MQAKSFAVSYSLLLALVSSNVLTALAQPGGYGGYGGYESPPPIPRHFNGMGGWDRGYGTGSGSYGAGSWGGWSRPNHRFHRYGWGSWATPYYAGGPGYGAANMSTVDEQGALYESRNYYIPDPNGITIPSVSGPYGWTSGTVTLMSEEKRKAAQPKIEHVALTSKYRLGPDTDVLEGGIIALHLTKDANLLVTAGNTRLVDQS
ncbi:MAG: hypothetical protein K2Z81_25275, partial [Cyanobacteria bacterium]|nr:hypothetical protein [Cyanobacteriota bacterium]